MTIVEELRALDYPQSPFPVRRDGTPIARAAADEIERLRQALECWPLKELLGMVEDSGDAAMWERARWFIENRDAALAGRAP